LGALLKHRISFEQELAVWRIVEPLGFDASPKIVARELFSLSEDEDEAEVSDSSLLDWHHHLAFTLAQYIPRPIPRCHCAHSTSSGPANRCSQVPSALQRQPAKPP